MKASAKVRKFAVIFCLLLLGTTLGLVTFEFVILRGILGYHGFVEPTAAFEYDPEIGWRFHPGAHAVHSDLDFRVAYGINQAGLRDREYSVLKPANTYRILVLGDSFTEGYGVEADETFSKQLEQLLPAKVGVSVEVINAGMRGTSTDQQLLYLTNQGMKFHPDLVLLAFVRGDENNTPIAGNMGAKRYFKPFFQLQGDRLELSGVPVPPPDVSTITNDRFEPWKSKLRPLAVYRWTQAALLGSNLRARLVAWGVVKAKQVETSRETADDELAFGPEAWQVEEKLLSQIKSQAEEHGAHFALFLAAGKQLYEKRLGDISRQLNIPFMDLSNQPEFAVGVANGNYRLHFDGHWNAQGHRAAAELLLPFVADQIKAMHGADYAIKPL